MILLIVCIDIAYSCKVMCWCASTVLLSCVDTLSTLSNELQTSTTRIHPGAPKQKGSTRVKPCKIKQKHRDMTPAAHPDCLCSKRSWDRDTKRLRVGVRCIGYPFLYSQSGSPELSMSICCTFPELLLELLLGCSDPRYSMQVLIIK